MTLRIVKLGIVSSIYGYFSEETGGDVCMYILPLSGFYKGNFVRVLAYTWFYKSENFCVYAHF